MKKKFIILVVIFIILCASVFLMTGCDKEKTERDSERIEPTLEYLLKKADVIVAPTQQIGDDCIEYTNYYVSYSESKLYVYNYFKAAPLQTMEEAKNNKYQPQITITEYDMSDEQMNEFRAFVENENEIVNDSNSYNNTYILTTKGKSYVVKDSTTLRNLVKDIIER